MGKLIVVFTLLIIAGILANYMTGGSDSIKSESIRLSNKGITEMGKIEKY